MSQFAIKPQTLNDYIHFAINAPGGALIGIIITSAASGKIQSWGLDFGAGKSNLLLDLMLDIFKNEEKVKENMIYFPEEIFPILQRSYRTKAIGWDDMQLTVGKHKWADMDIKELAYMLTTQRPNVAVIIGSAPHLGKLQKDFREFFHFEVKVPYRGYYEVQQIKHWTPFDNPTNVADRLDYKGESSFPTASATLTAWYEIWRAEKNQIYRDKLAQKWADKDKPKKPPIPEEEKSLAAQALANIRWKK